MADDSNKRIDEINEDKMNLYAREGIDRAGKYLDMPPEARKKADELEDLQKDTVDRERAGDYKVNLSKNTQGTQKVEVKRKKLGPLTLSLGTLIVLTGGSSFLLGPVAILMFFEKVLTNHGANDTKFNALMQRAHVGSWFTKGSFCSLPICDKSSSMSEKMRLRLEKEGFKIEPAADETTKRTKPTKITFPANTGGKVVTDAKGFHAETKVNYKAHVAATRAVNPKTATFIDKRAMMRKILGKYGASIGKVFKASYDRNDEERRLKMNQEIDKHTGATTGDSEARASRFKTRLTSDTRLGKGLAKVGGKITGAADLGSLACGFYTTMKVTLATVKVNWYKDLILFMLPIIQTIAMAEDQGNVEIERVDYVTQRLLETNPQKTLPDGTVNPGANKNALDSQPLQQVLYGYPGALSDITKLYTSWWIMNAVKGSGAVAKVEEYLGGRENVRTACLTAKAASLAGTAFCVSNPFSFAICGAAIGTALVYGDDISKWIVESITEEASQRMAEANLNSNLRYEPLGTAIVAGMGLVMMERSRSSGMKPARNSTQLKEFNRQTMDIQNQYIDRVAIEEGKANPLNPYNEYSFAGQLASTFNPYLSTDKSAFRGLANMFLLSGSALASITPKTFASSSYMQPNSMYTDENINRLDESLSQCEDPEMKDIGAVCAWYGGEITTADKSILEALEGEATGAKEYLGYLEKNKQWMYDRGYIDKDGKAIGDTNPEGYEEDWTEKSEYIKYLNNCPEDRPFPIGSSTLPIDDLDANSTNAAWDSGARCLANNADGTYAGDEVNEMINQFALYGNSCRVTMRIMDEIDGPDCANEKPPGSSGGQNMASNGDWGCPVNPKSGGTLTQQPHDIGNSTASGVDYAYAGYSGPEMAPLYAVRDGTVTVVAPASGYGNWIQVEHEENGQKVTSYYGHVVPADILVAPGQKVKKGDHIANISAGIVGSSTAPHLHIGLIMPSGPSAEDYKTRFMKGCDEAAQKGSGTGLQPS